MGYIIYWIHSCVVDVFDIIVKSCFEIGVSRITNNKYVYIYYYFGVYQPIIILGENERGTN